MSVLDKLINFWKSFGVKYVLDRRIKIPTGAATFSYETIEAVRNKKNVIFIYPCYRPTDSVIDSKIRNNKFIQVQVILCNFYSICKSYNLSPVAFAYESIASLVGDHMFNVFEDNWSSLTMKSFGIGWEYRVFGIEVLQITKFNTFMSHNVSEENIYEYSYGYERLNNMCNSNGTNNLINYFKNLNRYFEYFCAKNTDCLEHIFKEKLNKTKIEYEDFLILNLIFNILDTRKIYNIYTKNVYMKAISNKIKDIIKY